MKIRVTFDKPRDVGANDLDGVILRFPFVVQTIHEGAEKDTASVHTVSVGITGTRQAEWQLATQGTNHLQNDALVKTLFEYARREVEKQAREGSLQEHTEIPLLGTYNSPASNPFDVAKIPNPEGFSFEVELPKKIDF
ncbi:MAG: hypothetical protein DDT21_02664 [Syntrophomonadaceae bacterium]|nr:hypothetical protein [Bacillota bacterium]